MAPGQPGWAHQGDSGGRRPTPARTIGCTFDHGQPAPLSPASPRSARQAKAGPDSSAGRTVRNRSVGPAPGRRNVNWTGYRQDEPVRRLGDEVAERPAASTARWRSSENRRWLRIGGRVREAAAGRQAGHWSLSAAPACWESPLSCATAIAAHGGGLDPPPLEVVGLVEAIRMFRDWWSPERHAWHGWPQLSCAKHTNADMPGGRFVRGGCCEWPRSSVELTIPERFVGGTTRAGQR